MTAPSTHPNTVRWWNLDRSGKPVPVESLPERDPRGPELKNGSPYTPTFYADPDAELLPATHLHHHNGKIIGIHGEGDIDHLRTTLVLCLLREEEIIRLCAHTHHFDIMLTDVLKLVFHIT